MASDRRRRKGCVGVAIVLAMGMAMLTAYVLIPAVSPTLVRHGYLLDGAASRKADGVRSG